MREGKRRGRGGRVRGGVGRKERRGRGGRVRGGKRGEGGG